MADSEHKAVFTWPFTAPNHVVLTGSFDNWSSSVTMTKTDSGFEATVVLPWDTEVVYKYIVDGQWVVNDQQPKKDDGTGQINNVYSSPNAAEPLAVADVPAAVSEVQPETIAASATELETAKPVSEVKAEDQLGKAAETAPIILPPLVDVVPLATEAQHTTDTVPEATVGPTAAAPTTEPEDVKPAASLPIVEVLPSQDALPETAPVEGAATANESAAEAVEATLKPAIDGEHVPESTAAVEVAPIPAPESISPAEAALAPAPGAEVIPESTPAADATPAPAPSTNIVPESTPAVEAVPATSTEVFPTAASVSAPTPASAVEATSDKAEEAAPAAAPVTEETIPSEPPAVVVSDAVTVPVSNSTAAKVDAIAAPTEPTTEKATESVAAPKTDGQPVATPSTPEAKLRLNTSVKENEKVNGTIAEDGATQTTTTPTTPQTATDVPPREKRKSFFGRITSIFKPSS